MPPSCALLGGFAIGARVALLWQHNANPSYKCEREMLASALYSFYMPIVSFLSPIPAGRQLPSVPGQRGQLPASADSAHQRQHAHLAGRVLPVRRGRRRAGQAARSRAAQPGVRAADRARSRRTVAVRLGTSRPAHTAAGGYRQVVDVI